MTFGCVLVNYVFCFSLQDAFLAEFCAFTCGCLQSLKSVEEVEFSWNLDCFNYLTDAWLVFGTSPLPNIKFAIL
jgi:hypothetical protein